MATERDTIPELEAVRHLLRCYGFGCPQLETADDVREWLAVLGRRFAVHFGAKSRRKVLCAGWGPPHRRGNWLYPLLFKVGRDSHIFYLDLGEMHALEHAPQEQQLLVSERLYRWLEALTAGPVKPTRPRKKGLRTKHAG